MNQQLVNDRRYLRLCELEEELTAVVERKAPYLHERSPLECEIMLLMVQQQLRRIEAR